MSSFRSPTCSRAWIPLQGWLLSAILLAVSLPPVSTLIPFYTLYVQLGLVGTLSGLLIVTLTITIPIVAWMLIGFFRNLPPVERLARIDGLLAPLCLPAHFCADGPQRHRGRRGDRLPVLLERIRLRAGAGDRQRRGDLPAAISGFLFQVRGAAQLAACLLLTLVPPVILAFFCSGTLPR